MDPLTQGVLGAAASQVVSTPKQKLIAGVLGFLSGMAADLDVFIRSDVDPLLHFVYHRQFTHSLIFIPIGAWLCAFVFHKVFFRKRLTFKQTYLFCFAGYATHALLDACTTYGTLLLWPFSNARIAWNNVSVIDPLFTLPLLVLLMLAVVRRSTKWGVVSLLFACAYLTLGVVQNHRAMGLADQLASSRGHTPIRLGVKPSFANVLVWKSVYEYQGMYYVDAIRVFTDKRIIEGVSVEKLNLEKHFPWLDKSTQQYDDVQRFAWFSNHHLGVDPTDSKRIIDIRYSLLPNQVNGMWGIVLDQQASPQAHVSLTTVRPSSKRALNEYIAKLWAMIVG